MFFYEFCEIFENTFFYKTSLVAATNINTISRTTAWNIEDRILDQVNLCTTAFKKFEEIWSA